MSRWSLLLSMEGGKKQSPSHSSYNWNNVRNNHEIHSTKHIQRKDWLGFSEKCYEAEENLLQNWGNWFARVHVNYFRSDYYPYITSSIDKRLKFLKHHWLEQELRENFAPSHNELRHESESTKKWKFRIVLLYYMIFCNTGENMGRITHTEAEKNEKHKPERWPRRTGDVFQVSSVTNG